MLHLIGFILLFAKCFGAEAMASVPWTAVFAPFFLAAVILVVDALVNGD